MNTLESIIKKAKLTQRRIVLSEGEDSRVIQAAIRTKKALLAEPILIGIENNIKRQIAKFNGEPDDFEIINPKKRRIVKKSYADNFLD